MSKITFLNPEFFWLFLLIPIAILLVLKRNNQAVTLKLVQFKGSKNQLLYWQTETFFERIKIIGFKLLNCSYGKTKNGRYK
jgi:Ca-activated chloride channel family protein